MSHITKKNDGIVICNVITAFLSVIMVCGIVFVIYGISFVSYYFINGIVNFYVITAFFLAL